MHRPPPLRGRSPFDGRKVLLIDERQATREVRENVLRSHGVEAKATDEKSQQWGETVRFLAAA